MNTNPGNRPFEENGPRAAISTGPSLTDFNALVGLLQGAYNSLPSPGVQMYIQPQNTVHDAQVQPYHIQLLPPATGPGLAQWQVPQPAPTASQSILIVPPTPPYIHPSSSYLQPTTVHWMPPQPPPQPPIIPPPPPPPPQQVHPVAPVGSIPDDDKHLVCALKTFGAQKITLRQALEKLNGVNSHSASAWKDYFLDNLDAFYPLTKADQEPHPQATSSLRSATQGQSPSPSHPVLPPIRKSQMDASKPPPADRDSDTSSSTSNPRPPPPDAPSTSHSPISSRLAATYSRPLEYRSPPRVPDPAPHRSPDPDSAIDTQRSISGLRRRQGEPDAEFYAGTQIPPSNSDIRPRAPRPVRPTQDAGYRDTTGKSSDAYNVFFIHYLRWYVARVSRRKLTRQHILTELAKETPHYGVDAWRKHWEDDPEIPGHILAEAQRRADEHASLLSDEGEGDREYNEGSKGAPAHRDAIRRGDDGDGSDGAYDTDPAQLTRAPPRKVNVDDIRAMALYILEVDRDSSESWDVSRSRRKSFWREFSKRPENALRRSLDGWVKAAQYHESSKRDTCVSLYHCRGGGLMLFSIRRHPGILRKTQSLRAAHYSPSSAPLSQNRTPGCTCHGRQASRLCQRRLADVRKRSRTSIQR
ncbi:hypothetical protein C8Q78DRAFT_71166 [Trametes maxima]|nr:hypothetical protein C8Q78DRAFT_71166 [Trametes maxima]